MFDENYFKLILNKSQDGKRAFNSKKDALKFYQESSKIYDKDFSPEKGYVAMIGIFMTHITDEGRKFPRQRISRPLNSKEMKVLETISND